MKLTRMLLFAIAFGAGIGSAVVWLGRWQFVFAAVVVSVAAMCWGFATCRRIRRPEVWVPAGGSTPTLIFDTKVRDRSGFGCPRCPAAGFFSHRCVDGTIRPGAMDHLADTMPLGIYLPNPEDDDLSLPFSIGAHE